MDCDARPTAAAVGSDPNSNSSSVTRGQADGANNTHESAGPIERTKKGGPAVPGLKLTSLEPLAQHQSSLPDTAPSLLPPAFNKAFLVSIMMVFISQLIS
jgi:hypothetical protein